MANEIMNLLAEAIRERTRTSLQNAQMYNQQQQANARMRMGGSETEEILSPIEAIRQAKSLIPGGELLPGTTYKAGGLTAPLVPSQESVIPWFVTDPSGGVVEQRNIPKSSRITMQKPEPSIKMIDPITGKVISEETGQYGTRFMKGVLSPDQMRTRATATGESKAIEENIKSTSKMMGALQRMATIKRQFDEALPSGDRTPLEQRFIGGAASWATKYGLVDNPKLTALRQNIRPIAIQMIRAFGEVGNLSETEQKGAIDVVNLANKTNAERIAAVKQFAEFALAGANPQSIQMLKEREDIRGLLDAFNIDLPDYGESTESSQDMRSQYNALREQGLSAQEARKRLGM